MSGRGAEMVYYPQISLRLMKKKCTLFEMFLFFAQSSTKSKTQPRNQKDIETVKGSHEENRKDP